MFSMRLMVTALAGAGSLLVAFAPLGAQSLPPAPGAVQNILACRSLADGVARLACFDEKTAAMAQAIEKRDLVVVDREGVRSTRRKLFGLSLPNLSLLNNGDEEVSQIEGTIAAVGQGADGYLFILKDGGQWTQTDGKSFALEPAVGDKVSISKGALGSFFLRVGRQPGVKVRRTR